MNPYMAFEAVNTKISTKKSIAFDDKKLSKMMECETMDQVTDYLKSKYNMVSFINDVRSNTGLLRDDLETLLTRYMVSEEEEILHYFSGPYKSFLKVFLMRFEIADLVMILRRIARSEEIKGISAHFVHSQNYSKLSFDKLVSSKNVAQFIENLKDTPYYTSLKTVTANDEEKREFHSEMKLQLLFYKTLQKKAIKLDKKDYEAAREIIGTKIDFLNVQWIYRAKVYYGISPEEILIYTLQGGYRLSLNSLKKLVYSKTTDELGQLSNKYMKYKIFGSEANIKKNLDNGFYEYLESRSKDEAIGKVLWYFYMLDKAVKNLITVTEGIRYDLTREQIESYVMRKAKKVEVRQ